MSRIEMVNARAEELSKLSDVQLVGTILDYFEKNKTMPGEKNLKTLAQDFAAEFDDGSMTGMLTQYRKEIIEQFASLLVKEVKLKGVKALNDTKKNSGAKFKTTDLPMTLVGTRLGNRINTSINTFAMDAVISDTMEVSFGDALPVVLAGLPKGFKKNHPTISGMTGKVFATDYSNGNFANMSYTMLIDLGQNLAA